MMRNREIGFLTAAWLAASACCIGLGLACSMVAALAAGGTALVMGVIYAGFTAWRYREMRHLSVYLSRVYSGGKPLDIRDNREGELSMLKNDLYKITCVLERQAEQLYADKDYLAQSLANISHQLKTPLTGLFVMNDLLRDEKLPLAKRREFLNSSSEQLERIEWLVTSLLTLSRIDADVITFKRETISIDQLLAKAAEPLAVPMEAENIALSVDCPQDIQWQGDFSWTAEAVTNVLKNAAEHSPAGSTITVRVAENPLHTEIIVTDEGIGIAEEDLPFLFQRFYKGKQAQPGSVGIGLALAKTILQSQNGDIFASNAPEGGARFIIKLYKQTV